LSLADAANTVTFNEGSTPVAVDPSLTLADSQSTTLVSATAAISSGPVPGDTLTVTATGTNITASYSAGTLSLSGTDTLSNYQTVLRTVSFSGNDSTSGSRTIVWTANDGVTSASAVSTVNYAVVPVAPGDVSATAGDGQATVSFSAPASDPGAPITSYTVTSSPGGLTATGPTSPIVVGGLTNGTSYSFVVTATNSAGTGPPSLASNSIIPAHPSGGGGGGGGSSSVAITVSPPVQTVATGGTAAWTVSVTNTGGAYLYAVAISDPAAPGCGSPPSAYADTMNFMAPNVTVSYPCSLAGVTAALTNTVVVSAATGPGPVITQSATAAVSVQAALTPPPAPTLPVLGHKPSPRATPAFASLTISVLKTVPLGTAMPKLLLTVKVSKGTTLMLWLLDSKGHKLTHWIEHEKPGWHKLSFLLPLIARHKGHDTLRITETGNSKPKIYSVTLRT
jgi:hypothetical protein